MSTYFADKTRSFRPGTVLWLGLLLTLLIGACGPVVSPGMALTPPAGYALLGEADLYGYLRSRKTPGHTFFARASASGGWSMDTPFQLTLGGRRGVRGLEEEDFPGGRRVLLTLEDRIVVRWPAPELFDLGLTLFADAGRMWEGDVPWGVDSAWRGAVGIGLRFGFPSGTRGLVRMDLAFPVGMDASRGPIFRVTLLELLGVSTGFADPQVARSRRMTVGPDYFTTDRR